MQMLLQKAPLALGALVTLSFLTGGCLATKKHVLEVLSPVKNQINDVSKKTDQNTTAIGDLDRNVAKVDEKAMEADRKAGAAGDAARQAAAAASKAQQSADGANQLAQQSITKIGQVETDTTAKFNNLDNYKLATTEKVYFATNRYDLSDDDRAKLDQAIQAVSGAKNYAIEVEGFTDRTGPKALNLELGRRRADSVVRYLTVDKNIPLRKIHDVGVGADFPNAVNKTRDDRKENRRVDIKIYTLDTTATSAANRSPSQ
jgi:outer membrane protein OmpA-like peptidoglycan-associated protein